MTGCVSITDVLGLTPDPADLSMYRLRQLFGIGYDRAGVILSLAQKRHSDAVKQVMSECGVNHHEAVTWLWMLRQ